MFTESTSILKGVGGVKGRKFEWTVDRRAFYICRDRSRENCGSLMR